MTPVAGTEGGRISSPGDGADGEGGDETDTMVTYAFELLDRTGRLGGSVSEKHEFHELY